MVEQVKDDDVVFVIGLVEVSNGRETRIQLSELTRVGYVGELLSLLNGNLFSIKMT